MSLAPASARARAICSPIPLVPPVTMAVCPLRENISRSGELIVVVWIAVKYLRKKIYLGIGERTAYLQRNLNIKAELGRFELLPRRTRWRGNFG